MSSTVPLPGNVTGISGDESVSAGDRETYTAVGGGGATSFVWRITGGTKVSGGTSNSIIVEWIGDEGPYGTISVEAYNCSGMKESPEPIKTITIQGGGH